MRAEEVLGIGVIAFLLWWIWDHKGQGVGGAGVGGAGTTQAPPSPITYNVPSLPGSKIFSYTTPAPNLNFIKNQAGPTNNIFNIIQPTNPQTTPSPCSCACDQGAADMVTQTVSNFAASITKSLGKAYDTYVANLEQVLTPKKILDSFAGSSAAKANADLVQSSLDNAQKTGTGLSLTVGNVSYSKTQEAKDFLNSTGINGTGLPLLQRAGNITLASLNTYTPGRVVTLGAR